MGSGKEFPQVQGPEGKHRPLIGMEHRVPRRQAPQEPNGSRWQEEPGPCRGAGVKVPGVGEPGVEGSGTGAVGARNSPRVRLGNRTSCGHGHEGMGSSSKSSFGDGWPPKTPPALDEHGTGPAPAGGKGSGQPCWREGNGFSWGPTCSVWV